jgi:1-aminocyclopropane-1-carboxylate deaminase/D-cysteine desulfhydrase-like pyridoxal-dependent ACC family enzyme
MTSLSSEALTPWQYESGVWLKRDDLFRVAGVSGGKARTCWQLAHESLVATSLGLVTAGSRYSPQVNIVAHVGAELEVPVLAYVPSGPWSPEVQLAADAGARVVAVTPGHNSVIRARARQWADEQGWCHIPFGMECQEAVDRTAAQVVNMPEGVRRLVVPVGSGMSLAGILWGLAADQLVPVLGVCVGANPTRRLDKWAPPLWRAMVELVSAEGDYHRPAAVTQWGAVVLDSVYEAKCIPYLRVGDGLWCVGVRLSEEVGT